MADTSPMQSALNGIAQPGDFGADQPAGPGVTITERQGLQILHVAGDIRDAEFPTQVRHAIGLPLPMSAGETRASQGTRVLWLGPDRWLVATEDALPALSDAAAVNDVGQGRLVLRLTGPRVRDILAKGCPLDLHASAFPTGHCAESLIGHIGVTIDCTADETFDLYVNRSYAAFFWEWLTRAAMEYGYRVLPAG
ncbi:MAG: hypothetical protein HOB37_00395 [Rhodospirillaceae bacterium]|nr:hypothetical protein [Rhodospirillaceae bacterium]MBT5298133.1 hypothetical protein [Rhodospirillaceae bacterium]MBT6606908.1 hypothetical protein [Rhodospirillaceae bacterium]MBT6882777.1 hypothetical protein [Rhodospirillaceae bacterium]MBT7250131.1 hypothetical protein [Rhodospirillaceae bacterium]